MSEEQFRQGMATDGKGHWYVSTDVLERVVTEHGGEGTTPEDAAKFLADNGPNDTLLTLLWLRVEEFRARMNIVLNSMERFVAEHPREDIVDMAADAQTILREFIDLCVAVGIVETREIMVCYDDTLEI